MSNLQIQKALEKQRNELYYYLSGKALSGFFKEECALAEEGTIAYLNQTAKDSADELRNLSNDVSNDKAFRDIVESVNELDRVAITKSFESEVINLLNFIKENAFENELQAIFFEYDYYYHFLGLASGYGKQEYPLITEPRYVSEEIDFSKVVFQGVEAINFEKPWLDCEAFEWTTEHLNVYDQLLKLFQLNSRVLFHEALKECFSNGQFEFLKAKPFTFYINEHDCEVMTLFRIDQAAAVTG